MGEEVHPTDGWNRWMRAAISELLEWKRRIQQALHVRSRPKKSLCPLRPCQIPPLLPKSSQNKYFISWKSNCFVDLLPFPLGPGAGSSSMPMTDFPIIGKIFTTRTVYHSKSSRFVDLLLLPFNPWSLARHAAMVSWRLRFLSVSCLETRFADVFRYRATNFAAY